MFLKYLQIEGGTAKMRLIDKILSRTNLDVAIKQVENNKGAPGIDKMDTTQVRDYFRRNEKEIKDSILNMTYKPTPVRRVYIPKANGKQRPLGIPTVVDRVIQQAIAQQLNIIYEPLFSDHSYGFRTGRDCHGAVDEVLHYLNDGYQWVIDLDIEKYFDTVNHDKLISILREQVNDKITLHLIRNFLRAGIMDKGVFGETKEGVPQGGPLSPVLSNIYLDKFDKELESRGLNFTRYADDVCTYVKSEMSANRVMKSITSWLERKLFLKVSASKTKVVKPTKSNFLGFTFWKNGEYWKCKPADDRKARLYEKIRQVLIRSHAVARPMKDTFVKVNQIVRGWINYFKIGSMKVFIDKFGQWLRHKIRVIIIKKWKKPRTIYNNLQLLNKKPRNNFSHEEIYKVANSRLGLYRQSGMIVVNYLISPSILAKKKKERPGLVNPLEYYVSRI